MAKKSTINNQNIYDPLTGKYLGGSNSAMAGNNPVPGISVSPRVTGYANSGLYGVPAVPQYGQSNSQPGLTGAYFPGATSTPVNTGVLQAPTIPGVQPGTASPNRGSDAVRQLQIQLNNQNAGKPGWVALATDGIMGPKTIAAQSFTSPTTGDTAPAPGSVSSVAKSTGYTFQESPEDIQARLMRERINAYNLEQFNTSVDPNKIYNDTLAQYQAQIDALNNVYNDQLNQARIQGQGRIESRQFAQGRSGQIGSGTGEAGVNAVQDANMQVEKSIQNERAAAIAAIMNKVRNDSASDLAAKTKAKREGADAILAELAAAPERKKARISSAIKSLLSYKSSDSSNPFIEMSEDEIKTFTDGLGISRQEFAAEFEAQYKKTKDEARKTEADIAKTEAEVKNLVNKNDFEAAQKALDRALEEKKISVEWYKASTSRMAEQRQASDKTTQKNYDSKTIPGNVKQELFSDIVENSKQKKKDRKTLNEFITSYPEVDTDYLTELYQANQ